MERPGRESAGASGVPRPTLISYTQKCLLTAGNCDILGPGFLLAHSHIRCSRTPGLPQCPAPRALGWGPAAKSDSNHHGLRQPAHPVCAPTILTHSERQPGQAHGTEMQTQNPPADAAGESGFPTQGGAWALPAQP